MKIIITTTARSPSSISPPNPRTYSPERYDIVPSIKLQTTTALFSTSRAAVVVKCSKNGSPGSGNGGSLKDVLSSMVDERVEELLNKEENRGLLEGLDQASRRVEMAKRELAEIENQEIEAKIMRDYINQLESRASEVSRLYFSC